METVKTLKLRIKDRHAKALLKMARDVNVWNFCNETQYRSVKRYCNRPKAAGEWANSNTPISEALAYRDGYAAGRAASTATAMLDVLHDSNRENDRAWSAENRVARAAAPQADEAVTGEKKP